MLAQQDQMIPQTSTRGHSTQKTVVLASSQNLKMTKSSLMTSSVIFMVKHWRTSAKRVPRMMHSRIIRPTQYILIHIFTDACWTQTVSHVSSSHLFLSILPYPSSIGGRNVARILTECFGVLSRQMLTLPWWGSPMETGPLRSSLFWGHTALAQQYGLALLH